MYLLRSCLKSRPRADDPKYGKAWKSVSHFNTHNAGGRKYCVDINKSTLISLTCKTWWLSLEGIWTCPRTSRWGTPSPEHMWTKTNKNKKRRKCEQNSTHAHHFVLCHLGGAAMVSVCWARLEKEEDQRYLQIIALLIHTHIVRIWLRIPKAKYGENGSCEKHDSSASCQLFSTQF